MAAFKLALVLSIFPTAAFAAPNYTEILMDLFQNAPAPAVAEDFPALAINQTPDPTDPNAMTCIYLQSGGAVNMPIARFSRVTQGMGPLLPGYTEEKLMPITWQYNFDAVSTASLVGNSLSVTNSNFAMITSPFTGQTGFVTGTMELRKSDVYVPFKITTTYPNGTAGSEYYGYCYPNSQPALF